MQRDENRNTESTDEPQPLQLTKEQIAENAGDLIDFFVGAGERDAEPETQVVRASLRNGKIVYLRVRGLDEKDEERARKRAKAKTPQPKGRVAAMIPQVDPALYRSHMILEATVAWCVPIGDPDVDGAQSFKDVENLWDSKEARERLGVQDKADLIDKVFLAGQKTRLIEEIERLSGYDSPEQLEELAGN